MPTKLGIVSFEIWKSESSSNSWVADSCETLPMWPPHLVDRWHGNPLNYAIGPEDVQHCPTEQKNSCPFWNILLYIPLCPCFCWLSQKKITGFLFCRNLATQLWAKQGSKDIRTQGPSSTEGVVSSFNHMIRPTDQALEIDPVRIHPQDSMPIKERYSKCAPLLHCNSRNSGS